MSAFASCSCPTVVNPFTADQTCAYAGADGGVENVMKATSRAPYGLSQSRRVGIVLYLYGHVIDLRYFGREREITPARNIRRINHNASVRIQRSGRADANSPNQGTCFSVLGKEDIDRRYHGRETFARFAVRYHGSASLRLDCALAVHQTGSYFRASDIHANHESIVSFCHRRLSRRNSSCGASLRISCSWICTTPQSVPQCRAQSRIQNSQYTPPHCTAWNPYRCTAGRMSPRSKFIGRKAAKKETMRTQGGSVSVHLEGSQNLSAVILDYGQVLVRCPTPEEFGRMAEMFNVSFE